MSTKPNSVSNEYLYSEITMDLTWRVEPGQIMATFFERLRREKTLCGIRCPSCKRVYLPPRPLCGNCWGEMNEWVALGHTGTLVAKTVCHYKILNSETGQPRKTPFVLGLIRLDGADTTLNHFIEADDPAQVEIGDRVQIVFRDELQGNIGDIRHFKWLGDHKYQGKII
ncbi:MAG: Zn-ribbon domain-containing OB-fold protein [bacterium]